jgi:hypothetical protein
MADGIVGTCATFAPAHEERVRARHRCEEGAVLVKAFSRSAAGVALRAEDVRPEPVLCRAVDHLLGAVLRRADMGLRDGYIADCLRAARADATVQRICSARWAHALLRMARYHVAVGYLMCELRVVGEAAVGGLDAVANDCRAGEALGDAAAAVGALTARAAAAARGGGGEGTSALAALVAEVHALRLLRALAAPPAVAARILCEASAQLHACGGGGGARARWRLALAPALAWLGGRWGEFLRLAGAVPGGEPLLRAALHPLLPLARARLLAALNDAVPRALPFPLAAAARALAFSDGSRAAPGAGGAGAAAEEEPAWFRAARFAAQLRVEVRLGGGSDGRPATAEDLLALLRAWLAPAGGSPDTAAQADVDAITLHFNKAAPLPARPEEAAFADVRLRVALLPLREDAFLGAAAGCVSAAALGDAINAPMEPQG